MMGVFLAQWICLISIGYCKAGEVWRITRSVAGLYHIVISNSSRIKILLLFLN